MRPEAAMTDASELARREQTRDLAAGVVVALYRLAKQAQMHELSNQAFVRQLEQTHEAVRDYGERTLASVNVLFAHKAVFVAGQLLKGTRAVYDSATDLGTILEWCGGSELTIARDVAVDELRAFAEAISTATKSERGSFVSPTERIRLRAVTDAVRLRGLDVERLEPEQRVVRTYATAIVIMRRFFEDLRNGSHALPPRIKRIAQSLVDLSEGRTASFLGVTEARNQNADDAGRAVNTAILAVLMARQISDDRVKLAQIAMAAMMHDVARPRAHASAAAQGPALSGVVARLTEEAEDRLAAGSAAVLTTLGRINEPSMTRAVITFEAQWQRRVTTLGPLYRGARSATLQAKIVATARRYNDLVTPEPGLPPPSPDVAIATLAEEAREPSDVPVLRLLVAALGFFPAGTVVQLSTGEVAEVTASAGVGSDTPRVRIVLDAAGGVIAAPVEIDLADPARAGGRRVARVTSVEGWKRAARRGSLPSIASGVVQDEEPAATFETAPHDAPTRAGPSPAASSIPPAPAPAPPLSAPSPAPPPGSVRRPEPHERTVLQPSPFADQAPAPHAQAAPPATAEGSVATTPLVHVLVYMLDRELSGTVEFREPGGIAHAMYFRRGAPAKVRAGRMVAPLGEELSAAGYVASDRVAEAIEAAKRLGVLLGEYLVGEGVITRGQLGRALEEQVARKVSRLVNLPADTTYAYYKDYDALEGWGGEPIPCEPLGAILASVRYWHDRARIRATLQRIARQPLVPSPDADLGALELDDHERAALESLRAAPATFTELVERRLCDEETATSLVYMLAVTRQLVLPGQRGGPMGSARRGSARPGASVAPPAFGSATLLPRASTAPGAHVDVSVPPPPRLPAPPPAPAPSAPASTPPASTAPASTPSASTPAPATGASFDVEEAERALAAMSSFRRAEAALQRSDLATAERLAREAVEGDPDQPEYVALLAWVRAASGRPAATSEAIDQLTKVLRDDATCERALLYRGKLLKRAEKLREALRDFEAVLDINPRNREAASEVRLVKTRLTR